MTKLITVGKGWEYKGEFIPHPSPMIKHPEMHGLYWLTPEQFITALEEHK